MVFVIIYARDWYKTQQMCGDIILESGKTFRVCSWLLHKSRNVQ